MEDPASYSSRPRRRYDRPVVESFTVETFAPRLGSAFAIVLDDGTSLESELESVTADDSVVG